MLPNHLCRFIAIIAICTLGFCTALPGAIQVNAGQEDAALFQEVLSRYGKWLNYGQYGLVWRPGQVDRNWRPYTNGRWVPTQEGYVFETDEPWGWATYHYGNWLPTNEHGWVWVPGRTWYPHTVNWRTNDENVGWAPVPPPENLSSDTFYSDGYPATDYGSSGLSSYNTYPNGVLPSSWIFTRVTDFLLGWGLPYAPMYSYANLGMLVGPQYIPIVYERTVYVTNYVSPSYVANAYYNWGPTLTYISKVTTIKNIENDRRYKDLRLTHLRNVMPPPNLGQRHPAWREVLPMAGAARQGHLHSVPNFKMVSGRLNPPDAIPAPASLNPLGKATRSLSPLVPKQYVTAGGKAQPVDNNQSQGTRTTANAYRQEKGQEFFQKNLPAPTTTSPGQSVGQQMPAAAPHQSSQSRHDPQRGETAAYQENKLKRYREQLVPQDQERAEPELRMQKEQRLLIERRQHEASNHLREQQQMQIEQRRQAEMIRQQQTAQQQQQQQAEMMRARQMQQPQQVVRQAPPPAQPARSAPPHNQKKRDNQQQQ